MTSDLGIDPEVLPPLQNDEGYAETLRGSVTDGDESARNPEFEETLSPHCLGCGEIFGAVRERTTFGTYYVERAKDGKRWALSYCRQCAHDETRCFGCGHVFSATETVFRKRFHGFNCDGLRKGFCEHCAPIEYDWRTRQWKEGKRGVAPLDETYLPPLPCEVCGRPVRNLREGYSRRKPRKHVYCSGPCYSRGGVLVRNRAAAAKRKRKCAVCGMPFTPKRQDAKTCSSACRQRRYRLRRGVFTGC